MPTKDKKADIIKESQDVSSTQSIYVDSAGRIFSPSDIVSKKFRPKGRYRLASLSSKVNKKSFGKVKKNKSED
jgi:hypothetical protein